MKIKVLSLVTIFAILFVGLVAWRMDSFVRQDRTNWAQAQMRTQVSALQQQLESSSRQIQKLAPLFQSVTKSANFWSSLEPYKALTWIRDTQNPTLDHPQFREGAGLDDLQMASAVRELQGLSLTTSKISYIPYKDSQNRNWVLTVWPWNENRTLVLLSGPEIFQLPLEIFKGSLGHLALLNEGGRVLGHSQSEYFGTRMADSEMFKDFKDNGSQQGGGPFTDSSGEASLGVFSAVPGTNLVVLSSAKSRDLMDGKLRLWLPYLVLGLGLILLTLAGLSLMTWKSQEHSLPMMPKKEGSVSGARLQGFAPSMAPLPRLDQTVADAPIRVESSEKLHQAYKKIAASLGHELRGPLVRILGFSQMILEKEKNPEVVSNTDSILRETKIARELLDKLFAFAQEKEGTSTVVNWKDFLTQTVTRVQSDLTRRGVKVQLEIQDDASLKIVPELLQRSIEGMIQNSVEALERRPKKEIKISATKTTEGHQLTIEDNGEGIERENLEKIFDPFFTTRSFSNHMGLGLSAALGVVQQHGGQIKVESERGKFTKLILTLPEHQEAATSSGDLVKPEAKPPTVVDFAPPAEMSFSPADVEIEKLMDFREDEAMAPAPAAPAPAPKGAPVAALAAAAAKSAAENLETPLDAKMTDAPSVKPKFQAPPREIDEFKVEIRKPRMAKLENS